MLKYLVEKMDIYAIKNTIISQIDAFIKSKTMLN